MKVESVAAFHVKQQSRLSRQADPELAARASGLPGLGFAARSLIGLATALEACDHPAAPESDAGSLTRRQRVSITRPRSAEPGRAARPAGRAPRDRRFRFGAPGSAARRFDTPRFGSVRFGTARLTDPRSGVPRLGGARLNAPEQLTGADRIGVGRTALARSSRPGVLNPLARQHGHPPIALALAQGLPPGTVGTPARGTPARRTSARWPRQGGPAARRLGGPAARQPGSPAARQPGGPNGFPAENRLACVRSVGGTSRRLDECVTRNERVTKQRIPSEPSPPALLPDQRSGRAPTRQCRTAALPEPLRTRPSRTQPFSVRARGLPPISNADSRFTATTQSPAPVSRETTGEARQPNSRCDPGCSRFDRISAEGR
ncbi:hypothetical protein GA0070615_4107 [Micromonospora aurantiaca]|nr:hypothetical protein GA0070615_4107 [Micromonospora aurantiaca]